MTGSNSPSSTAQLPLPTRSSCTSPAAATSPSRWSSTCRRHAATARRGRAHGSPRSRPAALQDRPPPTPARQQRTSRSRPPISPTARPRRPRPRRLAPADLTRTVRCRLAFLRPLFRRSSVPHQARARDGTATAHTPCHLSCNEPRLGARNATRGAETTGLRRLPLTSACCSVRSRRCRQSHVALMHSWVPGERTPRCFGPSAARLTGA